MQHSLVKRQSTDKVVCSIRFCGFGGHFGQPSYTGGVIAMNMSRLMVH